MTHAETYLAQTARIAGVLDTGAIEKMAEALAALRARAGRLFMLGVGGGAANCAHAVNDFRKLCGIETYAPTDNAAELTARTNDEGFETVFEAWLKTSRLCMNDGVFIFSVGGGNAERNVSLGIVRAVELAQARGAVIFGVVGRDGGAVSRFGDQVVIVPVIDEKLVTPHTEAFQMVILHCLVSHPRLQSQATKW